MLNTILQHNVLKPWPYPDKSVHCIVTSPPYYGLRDYGVKGQLGLEKTPEIYIRRMVKVFREAYRVLRDDGTLWLNMGDTYATSGGPGWQGKTGQRADRRFTGTRNSVAMREQSRTAFSGYKPKDLMGMPWRLALALQKDGWYLRQDIIWHKANVMPELVRDRCTKNHEYVFLLTKKPRYFFDIYAILEPISPNTHARLSQDLANQIGSHRANGGAKTNGPMKAVGRKASQGTLGVVKSNASFESSVVLPVSQRNKRSVWTVPVASFSEAHFATFPEALIVDMIKAGTSAHGACASCGKPYTRIVEASQAYQQVLGESYHDHSNDLTMGMQSVRGTNVQNKMRDAGMYAAEYVTVGWKKSCKCHTDQISPCIVLDPFAGAGTTPLVARKLGRNFCAMELNPDYIEIANRRLDKELGMFR